MPYVMLVTFHRVQDGSLSHAIKLRTKLKQLLFEVKSYLVSSFHWKVWNTGSDIRQLMASRSIRM
jgi:hypothetical protein